MNALYHLAVRGGNASIEANLLPDVATRAAVRYLQGVRLRMMARPTPDEEMQELRKFIEWTKTQPIAIATAEANEQHYEVPTEFFKLCLGKHLKYSCCWYETGKESLDEAEAAMLAKTCERADLRDGQEVLELGCGWGSLSLWMAEHYPKSRITGVSNSATQREHIMAQCKERGLTNLTIITADMNVFEADSKYDRIVSVEMFEHMTNYEKLFAKVASWLRDDGRVFVHVFSHVKYAYKFEDKGDDDWMARYFFTGGTMPSDNLFLYYNKDLTVEEHWRVSGTHYGHTSNAWLKKMDANIKDIKPLFAATYGKDQVTKWIAYWRTFYIAVAECFHYSGGTEWIVSHYRFKKTAAAAS